MISFILAVPCVRIFFCIFMPLKKFKHMNTNYLLFLIGLFSIMSCQNQEQPAATQAKTSTPETSAPISATPPPIDPSVDLAFEYNWGIINGTQAPDSVKIVGNSRYFDYGVVEVQTKGHSSLSGEHIEFKHKGQSDWQVVSDENHLFFLGFDKKKHFIIDRGTTKINRDLRLFDIQNSSFSYQTKYNNSLIKNGWLYILRFTDPSKVAQLPQCDESGGARVIGYEEVVAVDLNTFLESKTGQVFCVYK